MSGSKIDFSEGVSFGLKHQNENLKESQNSSKKKDNIYANFSDSKVKKTKKKVEPSLNDCLSLFGYNLKKNLKLSLIWNISSITETTAVKLATKEALVMTGYSGSFMVRVYPKGTRFDSSNYDPMPLLSAGVQLVALNLQTNDINQGLILGKFMDNGRCGYVLKPSYMRNSTALYNPGEKPPGKEIRPSIFSFTLISGIQLSRGLKASAIWDPVVSFSLKGASIDESSNSPFHSRLFEGNGFHTVWTTFQNQNRCEFSIFYPETAILVVLVKTKAGKTLGQNFIPFTMLREGYRVIPLLQKNFVPKQSAFLLVNMIKK
jgi:phosphatidylinositol phospholipase C, delta